MSRLPLLTEMRPMLSRYIGLAIGCGVLALSGCNKNAPAESPQPDIWKSTWQRSLPGESQVDIAALEEVARRVGGAGFVVHRGRAVFQWGHARGSRLVRSVMKPIIATLNLMAVEDGLVESLDDPIVKHLPEIAKLNDGTDSEMTWRHLTSMTSGYGLKEAPGEAFAYNDYSCALWYDTLMQRVFQRPGDDVLLEKLATPLGFEDRVTFQAYGPDDVEPKMKISARDLARYGQMILERGQFQGKQILHSKALEAMLTAVVPKELPLTSGQRVKMLPGQHTIGGTHHQCPFGPGRFVGTFWLNVVGPEGRRLFPDAPEDLLLAVGNWGEAALWIFPSLDLVVTWNECPVRDFGEVLQRSDTEMNRIATLLTRSVP